MARVPSEARLRDAGLQDHSDRYGGALRKCAEVAGWKHGRRHVLRRRRLEDVFSGVAM